MGSPLVARLEHVLRIVGARKLRVFERSSLGVLVAVGGLWTRGSRHQVRRLEVLLRRVLGCGIPVPRQPSQPRHGRWTAPTTVAGEQPENGTVLDRTAHSETAEGVSAEGRLGMVVWLIRRLDHAAFPWVVLLDLMQKLLQSMQRTRNRLSQSRQRSNSGLASYYIPCRLLGERGAMNAGLYLRKADICWHRLIKYLL